MSEAEVETKPSRRKLIVKVVKAAVITTVYGVIWFVIWLLLSNFLPIFQWFSTLYWILVYASLFFTFAIKISEGTIYKYILVILRSFFIIVYIVYSTNFGVFTINIGGGLLSPWSSFHFLQ